MNATILIDRIALILVIVGGLNWGLFGLFGLDLVALLFGDAEMLLSRIVYVLVGLGAVWSATLLFRPREERL